MRSPFARPPGHPCPFQLISANVTVQPNGVRAACLPTEKGTGLFFAARGAAAVQRVSGGEKDSSPLFCDAARARSFIRLKSYLRTNPQPLCPIGRKPLSLSGLSFAHKYSAPLPDRQEPLPLPGGGRPRQRPGGGEPLPKKYRYGRSRVCTLTWSLRARPRSGRPLPERERGCGNGSHTGREVPGRLTAQEHVGKDKLSGRGHCRNGTQMGQEAPSQLQEDMWVKTSPQRGRYSVENWSPSSSSGSRPVSSESGELR